MPLPGADCLQSVSGNSRVLDTLASKLRVEANSQSISLLPTFEQLESGAWHHVRQPVHANVQLEADPSCLTTTWSIHGVCCTSNHSPAIPFSSTSCRSQMAAPDHPIAENSLYVLWWPATMEIFEFRRNRKTI